jgi:hypothetical protein
VLAFVVIGLLIALGVTFVAVALSSP